MRRGVQFLITVLLLTSIALPSMAGHWSLAFWRCLGKGEAANNLFVRIWTFDENGNMIGSIPITTPTGTLLATTEATGRVDFPLNVANEYQCKVGQAGSTSDITPYMSNGRYPNWGHYSYELGFMYKSNINNAGTFDTSLVCGPEPRMGGNATNAPCTKSMAYYSFDPCSWFSDEIGYDLPGGGWGEHGQTFVPNGNRVACVQFHPTVSGVNQLLQFTVEIRQGGPTGPVIATKTSAAHYNQDWWIVPFGANGCQVVPGQTYFARVYTSGGFNAYYAKQNYYPNGQAYWRANSADPWSTATNPELKGFIVCCNATERVQITNVNVVKSTGSATVTWTTNKPATSRIDYGLSSAYGKYVSDATLKTSHSITLSGLRGDTIYHYTITSSASGYDDGITADSTFVTDSANPNLLTNGGFEARDINNNRTLSPWVKYGVFSNPAREDGLGPWCTGKCPPEGSCSFVSIASYSTKNGGAYQRVYNVVPGATYTARMTYYTWQQGGSDSDCANRLGIDPYGGVSYSSANIVWTPELSSQDTWTTATVSTTASSSVLTVFLQAIQKWGLQWNTNGFDDIRLSGPIGGNVRSMKDQVDGAYVALTNKVVTATSSQIGAYYIQETDNYSGIRVEAISGTANLGDVVTVSGWMATIDGERAIIDATITKTSSGSSKLVTLGHKSVGGTDLNSIAKGGLGKFGPNNVGILIKSYGKVTSKGTGEFYMTDGSGESIRVKVPGSVALPNVDDYVVVTGISRISKSGSNYIAFIELRQTGDWRKVN